MIGTSCLIKGKNSSSSHNILIIEVATQKDIALIKRGEYFNLCKKNTKYNVEKVYPKKSTITPPITIVNSSFVNIDNINNSMIILLM
jgi:hypothetical protein